MKAIRIHSFGGPDVLAFEDAPRPPIGSGEVLVKVHAASVNPVDRFIRAGYLQGRVDLPLPLIPGMDLSGVVEAIGPAVSGLAVGDAVFGFSNMIRQGTYAETAAVSASEVALKPATLDHLAAAAVPLAALTARQALDLLGLESGQTVLIHGAAGGVGTYAVQFALLHGVRVLATATARHGDLLRDLGVTTPIDSLHGHALRGHRAQRRCRVGPGRRRCAGAVLDRAEARGRARDDHQPARPGGSGGPRRARARCDGPGGLRPAHAAGPPIDAAA